MDAFVESPAIDEAARHEATVRRAHELWELRGRIDGHAEEDWAQAEAEVRKQWAQTRPASQAFLSIKGERFVYTCSYDRNGAAYHPGDIVPGQTIRFRVVEGKLFLKLGDNRELETTVIRKVEMGM
jgi:DUF2934 family protein